MNLVNFRGIWGNNSKKIPNLLNLLKIWVPILPNSLATLLFKNSCCFFLKTRCSDRHYRILNWSKNVQTEDVQWKFHRYRSSAGHLRLHV